MSDNLPLANQVTEAMAAVPLEACNDASFEQSLAELEGVVHDLEDGQLGLTEALARYEHGVKHLKRCYEQLQNAERKIELLMKVADDGTPLTEPFDQAAQPPAETVGRRRRQKSPAASGTNTADRDIDASP